MCASSAFCSRASASAAAAYCGASGLVYLAHHPRHERLEQVYAPHASSHTAQPRNACMRQSDAERCRSCEHGMCRAAQACCAWRRTGARRLAGCAQGSP